MREQAVLFPCLLGVERDAARGERAAVARDPLPLVRAAQLGGDRIAEHVGDVAHARRDIR